MKKHNFYAGPSILSEYTIKNTAAAIENFAGMGLSLMEISHRSKEFVAVNDEARALIKELLDIPAGYEVVFLGRWCQYAVLYGALQLVEQEGGLFRYGNMGFQSD